MQSQAPCLNCNVLFNPPNKELNRNNGKFCCLKCACIYNGFKRRTSKIPNALCCICSKEFYRVPSKLRTKHGFTFCSRECKELAQSKFLETSIIEIQPSHYHTDSNYRLLMQRKHNTIKCFDCDFNEIEILEVHHLDKDRSNNQLENLIWLCPNCHTRRHRSS